MRNRAQEHSLFKRCLMDGQTGVAVPIQDNIYFPFAQGFGKQRREARSARYKFVGTGDGDDEKIDVTTFCRIVHTRTEQIQFVPCGEGPQKGFLYIQLGLS